MEIRVNFLKGQQLEASFGSYSVISDQSPSIGGSEQYPEPADYFASSMALCAAFYIRSFCEKRDISMDGIVVTQNEFKDERDKYKRTYIIEIVIPESFPIKYKSAVMAAAKSCTVKKIIESQPNFEISVKVS